MQLFSQFNRALMSAGLLASGLAFASGSSSASLKLDIDFTEATSTYASFDSDAAAGTVVYEVIESSTKGMVKATLKGESEETPIDQVDGEKQLPDFERITVKQFDATQVELHVQSSASIEFGSEPIVQDVRVLAKLADGATWAQYLAGEEIRLVLDSRAQAKLERSTEASLGRAFSQAFTGELDGARLKSLSSDLSYGDITLSLETITTRMKGKMTLDLAIPGL